MTKTFATRLHPGQDLKKEIQAFVVANNIQAGWICTCIGSLTGYHIRFANQKQGTKCSGHFEILSLSGTISKNGSHLHICISDNEGKTIGGHLLDENIIFTTGEIVLQSSDEFLFVREPDEATGFKELKIKKTQ